MAKRPGGYSRNVPPRLPKVGIGGSLNPTGYTAANPQFLQTATSASARDLQQLQQAIGSLGQLGGSISSYAKSKAAAHSGTGAEEGKRTAAEYVAAIGMGRSEDGSNAQYFPEDAYVISDDFIVNPWLTPGMGVGPDGSPRKDSETEFNIEEDPLWLYVNAQADAHTDGSTEEFKDAYDHAFVLPVYKALVKHRIDLTQKYDAAITGNLQSDLTSTDEKSTTPNAYSIKEGDEGWTAEEAYENHRGVLGMSDNEGNLVQNHPMSMAEWQVKIVLPAVDIAIVNEDWETAERLLKWGENGDQVEAAKQQVRIDTGRSEENLAVQRDLMGEAVSQYVTGLRTDDRVAASGLPPDLVATLTKDEESAMGALANRIGVFYYTDGGSSNADYMAAFKTSIEGSILAVAQKHGAEEAVATINELLLSDWTDPETGETSRFAPEGSDLNRDMRKWLNTQVNNARTGADSQYASKKQEMNVTGLGIIHEGLDNGLSAEEIREELVEVLGSSWGPVSFGDISTAMDQRKNEINEGVSEPGRVTWTSGAGQVGYHQRLLNARDHNERMEIMGELQLAIKSERVNPSRLVEAMQLMQSEPQYDQARNHPAFTGMMDSMTSAFELTLRDEGDGIVTFMDKRFIAGEPRVQQLGQGMMTQWRDFVKGEAMHKLWQNDRNAWELAANEYVDNMRKAWWPELGVAVRDIVETGKGPDAWTGSVNALEGVNSGGDRDGTYWTEDNANGNSKTVMKDGKPTEVKVVVSEGLWQRWVKMRPGEVTIPEVPLPASLQVHGATN